MPQECVLSPLLFTLFTHDCSHCFPSNSIFKFSDDTTVLVLITDNDDVACRGEVEQLAAWCYSITINLF